MNNKIQIDHTLCIAFGTCCGLNPARFDSGGDEKSTVIEVKNHDNASSETFNDEEIESAKQAEDICPVIALTATTT